MPASAVFTINSLSAQPVSGLAASSAAGAAKHNGLFHLAKILQALRNQVQGNVDAAGHMAARKFSRGTYIDYCFHTSC